MSWLSSMLKAGQILAVIQKVKEEAPDAVPLLNALEANDYEAAADVVLSYGDTQEMQAALAEEIEGGIGAVNGALPLDLRPVVEPILREALSVEVQQKVLRAALVSGLEKADAIIPEEALLKALALAGIS